MKRIGLWLCVCLLLIPCLASCESKPQSNPSSTPDETPILSAISDEVQLTLVDDTQKVWLDNSHFVSVEVKTGEDGAAYLEFVTTEAGKALLAEATEANLKKPLTFMADNMILFSPVVSTTIENGEFAVANNKTYDARYIYNLLSAAEDPMEGVRPPSYVIKSDKAKTIAYDKAGVTPDEVLDVSCSMTFDRTWRGWKYTVKFRVQNLQHVCEINAVTGTVLKYS